MQYPHSFSRKSQNFNFFDAANDQFCVTQHRAFLGSVENAARSIPQSIFDAKKFPLFFMKVVIRPLLPDCCSERVSLTVWLKQRLCREISYLRVLSTQQKIECLHSSISIFPFQCNHVVSSKFQRCFFPVALPGADQPRQFWIWIKPSCSFGTQPLVPARTDSTEPPAIWEHWLFWVPTSPW